MRKKKPILVTLLITPGIFLSCCNSQSPQINNSSASAPALVERSTTPKGTRPLYNNSKTSIEDRVEDLLDRMTLSEKIGQVTQVEKNSIDEKDITNLFIGSLLSGGGGYPANNTPGGWVEMVNNFQKHALQTRLGIPLIYGVDAVHGHGNVRGAVVFPHNIGLGAARDPDLVEGIGRITAIEMAATGIYWNFAPVVAVPQDIRWGRNYEGYSENTDLVTSLGTAYIKGLQNVNSSPNLSHPATVLATPKHFVGDGGTAWASSKTFITKQYMLDQGVTHVDESTLRAIHLPPYKAAIDAGAMCVMVSFSSWRNLKMHAQKYLLTDVLKGELGFKGFLVSDWEAIDQIPGDYYNNIVTSINAGLDMIMVPTDYRKFINELTKAINNGDIPMERIDDAVRRILTVKFQLGLFERPFAEENFLHLVGSDEHREVAREAVRKSLVLLKNDKSTLPLPKDTPLIFVAGQGADDIGIQCGGWTIEWQGKTGNITQGTTILEGVKNTVAKSATVIYNKSGNFEKVKDKIADIGIVVVGEMPYAEGVGDLVDLTLSKEDVSLIKTVKKRSKKVIVILLSGRPMIITEQLDQWDALIAAWLPGTEGQGVADALFGNYPFTGKLPFTWPRAMDQIPLDLDRIESSSAKSSLFPFGYGLKT